jgi:hypothetical protein
MYPDDPDVYKIYLFVVSNPELAAGKLHLLTKAAEKADRVLANTLRGESDLNDCHLARAELQAAITAATSV